MAVLAVCLGVSTSDQDVPVSNRIAMPSPGDPLYYMNADAGLSVGPTVSLKRTNRSLLKWWDDLFLRNNCCNNNNNVVLPPAPVVPPIVNNNCNNGFQLQDLDPFKQIKLLKKLPDLFTPSSPCGQTCGGCGQLPQPQPNYVAPLTPAYGGEEYAPVPEEEYVKPSPNYNGPGDGDAGYVAPVAPAPAPAVVTYEAPAPAYEAPAPAYEVPVAPPAAYEAPASPAVEYVAPPPPVPAPAADVYAQPAPAAAPQLPPIVYQPIIYVSTPLVSKSQVQVDENQAYGTPPAPPAPVYEAPAPVNNPPPPAPCGGYPAYAPATPNYATPSCQSPIRLSLIDQPFRVAPELFEEYNYRLALAAQNLI